MRHVLPTLAVTTALLALPAFAAGQFSDMDADADGSLSMTEFDTGMQDAGWFMKWNTNGDETLSRDEFETGLYGLCDADANSEISNSEFDSCISAWMGDKSGDVAFGDWDADASDSVSQDEFAAGIEQSMLFEDIAGTAGAGSAGTMASGSTSGTSGTMASGSSSGSAGTSTSGTASTGASGSAMASSEGITEDAFKQGLFDRFDANADGMLSQDELPQLPGTMQQ